MLASRGHVGPDSSIEGDMKLNRDNSSKVNAKAQKEQVFDPIIGRDVPVKGQIETSGNGDGSPEALVRAQRLLDRLLWMAFTKRGRHENNVR